MPLGAFKAALMGTAGVSTGDVVLLHDTDYSGVDEVDITSGIDSTYGEYIFGFYNIHPNTDNCNFTFQVNGAGESGFNETMSTTQFAAYHDEDDDSSSLTYQQGHDQAEGTDFQIIFDSVGGGADESLAGELHLFNPSSTTYVKHFYARFSNHHAYNKAEDSFAAGYINTTAAIDEISFKMHQGNFDGIIKMWGVK